MLRLLAFAALAVVTVHGATVLPETTVEAGNVTDEATANATECEAASLVNQLLFNVTSTSEFDDLQEHEQILVYELLAAAEACDLASFVNVETAQRIFLLTESE